MRKKYILKKYKCHYCGLRHDNEEKIKKHEEKIHGCFRDINPRIPITKKNVFLREPSEEDKEYFGRLQIGGMDKFIDITYKWNENTHDYDMFTDETKYGDNIKILWNPETNMFKICDIKRLRRDWKNAQMS